MTLVIVDMSKTRLNPCSNGICSLSEINNSLTSADANGLNPCSNGICSLRRDVCAQKIESAAKS